MQLCSCGCKVFWKAASCKKCRPNTDRDKRYHEARTKNEVCSSEETKVTINPEIQFLKLGNFWPKHRSVTSSSLAGMLIHTQYGHMTSLYEKYVNKSLSWYSSPQSKSKLGKQIQVRQSSVASPEKTPPWMRILTAMSFKEGKPQTAPRSFMQLMNHSK